MALIYQSTAPNSLPIDFSTCHVMCIILNRIQFEFLLLGKPSVLFIYLFALRQQSTQQHANNLTHEMQARLETLQLNIWFSPSMVLHVSAVVSVEFALFLLGFLLISVLDLAQIWLNTGTSDFILFVVKFWLYTDLVSAQTRHWLSSHSALAQLWLSSGSVLAKLWLRSGSGLAQLLFNSGSDLKLRDCIH